MKKIIIIILCFILQNCSKTKPLNFYNIKPINNKINTAEKHNGIKIGINKVKIPNYLDKPQIITLKNSDYEYSISEINRWLEPLKDSIQKTIKDNLKNILNNKNIEISETNSNYTYKINVEIVKLESRFNDKIYFEANYSIINLNGNIVKKQNFRLEKNINETYVNLVEKISEILFEFTHDISKNLK